MYKIRKIQLFFIFILISHSFVLAQETKSVHEKKDNEYAILFRLDNDLIYGSDDYYTNGLYLGFVNLSESFDKSIFPNFIGHGLAHLPGLNPDGRMVSSSFSFAHRMFTPHDIQNRDFIPDDMPYSGQLLLSVSAGTQNSKHLDAWTLSIGEIGPVTRAAELQFDVHYSLFAPEAEGWNYQLKNEVIVNLFYEHRFRFFELGKSNRIFDTMLAGSGGLGNLTSFAELGFGFRLGWNIPNDFYLPTSKYVNPMIGIMPTTASKRKLSCYFFANISGAYVLNNIALDGNTFEEYSPYIEYDHFGTLLNCGFAFDLYKFRIIFTAASEKVTWENSFNIKEDVYGQLSFCFGF